MADSTIVVSDANDVDRSLRTDEVASVHTPKHIVQSSALPDLASTSTLQSTINTSIAAGNTSLASLATTVGGGGGQLQVDLVDLGGASTATLQGTANGYLSTIDGDTSLLAGTIGSAKVNVNIASDGASLATAALQGTGNTSLATIAGFTCNTGAVVLAGGSASIGRLGTANSGVDIGDVDVTSVAIPTTIYHGQETVDAAGTDQTIRPAGSQAITSGVTVKALAGNTGIVYVGAEGVAAAAGFELSAKESVFLEVADIASVWIDAATTDDGVSWIAS